MTTKRKPSEKKTGSAPTEAINRHLGARVKQLRSDRGWSLEGLANASGVTRSMPSQIEREQANPTLAVTLRIAQAFGMTLGELLEVPGASSAVTVIRANDHAFHYRSDELGVRLSIDDFGTGYSSLSYLNQFPLDTLKIYRSFVTYAAQDISAQAIIKAIVAMGHALNFEILAEGVEEAAQITLLRDNAVDILQGFFFSRPVAALEFEELIVRNPAYTLPERPAHNIKPAIPLPTSRRR